jgi:hypothetical protein
MKDAFSKRIMSLFSKLSPTQVEEGLNKVADIMNKPEYKELFEKLKKTDISSFFPEGQTAQNPLAKENISPEQFAQLIRENKDSLTNQLNAILTQTTEKHSEDNITSNENTENTTE